MSWDKSVLLVLLHTRQTWVQLHRPNLSPHPTYYVEHYYLQFLLLFNIADYIILRRGEENSKAFSKRMETVFGTSVVKLIDNRPFPSSLVPLFQSESKCQTFHMKMSSARSFFFMQIKVIFIRMVSHLDSPWNRGTREHGNGLFIALYQYSKDFCVRVTNKNHKKQQRDRKQVPTKIRCA